MVSARTVRKLQVIRFPPSMEQGDAIEARGQWADDSDFENFKLRSDFQPALVYF